MTQQDWIPVVCNRTKPPPATAAADFIGIDDATTHRWLCKGIGANNFAHVPASEWICSSISQACGLPVPPFAVITLASDPSKKYFGSQWQGGALDYLKAIGKVSNSGVFEQTHAVDLFVNNTDRHCGNYLYLDIAGDIVAKVIDFSHALIVEGWPLPQLPLDVGCHTSTQFHHLQACYNPSHTYSQPLDILQKLRLLPDDWMEDLIHEMPTEWLDNQLKDELCNWWKSPLRSDRIQSTQGCLP